MDQPIVDASHGITTTLSKVLNVRPGENLKPWTFELAEQIRSN
jgi:hypothetical protein